MYFVDTHMWWNSFNIYWRYLFCQSSINQSSIHQFINQSSIIHTHTYLYITLFVLFYTFLVLNLFGLKIFLVLKSFWFESFWFESFLVYRPSIVMAFNLADHGRCGGSDDVFAFSRYYSSWFKSGKLIARRRFPLQTSWFWFGTYYW